MKIPKVINGILCMFIQRDDVTHVKTQFNSSKLQKLISLWKIVKNTIKRCRRFFFYKINKNMQKTPVVKCFVNLFCNFLKFSLVLGKRDCLVLSDPKLTLGQLNEWWKKRIGCRSVRHDWLWYIDHICLEASGVKRFKNTNICCLLICQSCSVYRNNAHICTLTRGTKFYHLHYQFSQKSRHLLNQ